MDTIMSNTILLKERSINSVNHINQLIIMRDKITNNLLIYNYVQNNNSSITNQKQRNNNQYMFIKCLLYLRNYFVEINYKCSIEEMQHISSLAAKAIYRVIDENNFDEQMALIATSLAKVLAS